VSGSTNSQFQPGAGGTAGVWGNNAGSGTGVKGTSVGGDGVLGFSGSKDHAGVSAVNGSDGFGVWAASTGGTGVFGGSTSGRGVFGNSDTWQGVYGHSGSQAGVVGESDQFDGVFGISHDPIGPGFQDITSTVQARTTRTVWQAGLGVM
jgi:hypothetical protein